MMVFELLKVRVYSLHKINEAPTVRGLAANKFTKHDTLHT